MGEDVERVLLMSLDHARTVDHDVEIGKRIDHRRHRCLVGHVEPVAGDSETGRRTERLDIEPCGHNACPQPGQSKGNPGADSATATGDDGGFACEEVGGEGHAVNRAGKAGLAKEVLNIVRTEADLLVMRLAHLELGEDVFIADVLSPWIDIIHAAVHPENR